MGMKNLVLRVGLALSIVCVAIGMTFAVPNGFGRSEAATSAPAASVAPAVAGYQAAPVTGERAAATNSSTQGAATLIALATTVVLLAIFAILFSYRPRPGGVRASHR
jgi:4-amino-4-deoxy-L-arabinose transferase-like glycosyltransferase